MQDAHFAVGLPVRCLVLFLEERVDYNVEERRLVVVVLCCRWGCRNYVDVKAPNE